MKAKREEYNNLRNQIREDLPRLPKGKLQVTSSHGSYQYRINGKYYRKKNSNYLRKLAQRDYYEKIEKALLLRIQQMDSSIQMYENDPLEEIYRKTCDGRKALLEDSIYKTVSQRVAAFEKEEFPDDPVSYKIENDIYTYKGEHVRSKSEKIIADELCLAGIPYHYEKPIVLIDNEREIVLHPDFTVMNPRDGKIYYIEHFGMMDNLEYVQKAMDRISLYEKNGLLLGRDLLIFHETKNNALNVRVLKKYIEEHSCNS